MRKEGILVCVFTSIVLLGMVGCGEETVETGMASTKLEAKIETSETIDTYETEDKKQILQEKKTCKYQIADAIEGQVFQTEFDIYGEVTFAPFWTDEEHITVAIIKDEEVCYENTMPCSGGGDHGTRELIAVSFEDINADQNNDIVLIVKTTSYWEHSDQTYEHYETFLLLQDDSEKTFQYEEELSQLIERIESPDSIEKVREAIAYLQDTEYEKVPLLVEAEASALTTEGRMQAFLESKIQVVRKDSLLDTYRSDQNTDMDQLSKPVTLQDLMRDYMVYMEDTDYPNIKPKVNSLYLTAKERKYLLISIACPIAMEGIEAEYLIGDFDGQLQIVYEGESWSRSCQNYYDGIIITSGGSSGATHHGGEMIGINDAGIQESIYGWEEQTISEWRNVFSYRQENQDCDIDDFVEIDQDEDGYYESFLLTKWTIGDQIYWTVYDDFYRNDPNTYQKKHDKTVEALKKSNILEGGMIISEEEGNQILKDKLQNMGYPWIFEE